jgi:hypothetical protein
MKKELVLSLNILKQTFTSRLFESVNASSHLQTIFLKCTTILFLGGQLNVIPQHETTKYFSKKQALN